MHRVFAWLAISTLMSVGSVAAQERIEEEEVIFLEESSELGDEQTGVSEQAGAVEETERNVEVSRTEVIQDEEGAVQREVIGFKPQIGVVNFTDILGQDATRAAAGLTLDVNLAAATDVLFFGPSTGVIYSHIGGADANFIGTDATFGGPSANFLLIPANGKVGFNVSDAFRVAAHGGGNLIYRSSAASVRLSPESTAAGGADWTVFPNVGADLEISTGSNSAIILRPDWTFSSGEDLFTGTLGFTLALG